MQDAGRRVQDAGHWTLDAGRGTRDAALEMLKFSLDVDGGMDIQRREAKTRNLFRFIESPFILWG